MRQKQGCKYCRLLKARDHNKIIDWDAYICPTCDSTHLCPECKNQSPQESQAPRFEVTLEDKPEKFDTSFSSGTQTLSDKFELHYQDSGDEGEGYYTHEGECFKEKDVKESVKKLKEELGDFHNRWRIYERIDKIFGDKLIKVEGGKKDENN